MAKKVINTGKNIKKILKKPVKTVIRPKTQIKISLKPKVPVKIPLKSKIPVRKHMKPKFSTEISVEKALVENFISLQKVMTNLSVSFDNLSSRISKLLDLFELSAKALAEKDFNLQKTTRNDTEIRDKLDGLMDQNKIIARGLTLLHEGEDAGYTQQPQTQTPIQNPPMQQEIQQPLAQPLPQQPSTLPKIPSQRGQAKSQETGEYKKSISSNE